MGCDRCMYCASSYGSASVWQCQHPIPKHRSGCSDGDGLILDDARNFSCTDFIERPPGAKMLMIQRFSFADARARAKAVGKRLHDGVDNPTYWQDSHEYLVPRGVTQLPMM